MQLFAPEWCEAASEALHDVRPGASVDARLNYVIDEGPMGKVTVAVTVTDGAVSAITPGKSTDPDLVVSMKYDSAVKILTEEMSSEVGYMNGELKVEGAHKRWLLDLRPLRRAVVVALAPVMAATEI